VISAEAKKSTAVLIPCIKLSENVEQIYVYKIINPPDTIQNLVKSSANLYKSSRDVNVYLETSYSAILNANPILSRLNEDTAFGDELKNKWISIPLSYPEVEETSTTDSALLTDLGKLQAEQKFIETSFSKMQNYVIEITDYKNSEHLDANDKAQISKKLEYIQLLADGLNDHKEGYDTFFSSKFVSDYQKDLSNFKNLLDMAVKYSAVYITSLSEPLEEYGRPDMIPFLESSESFSANLNALTESYDGIFSKLITELKKESSTDSTTSETEETWGYVNEDNLFVVEKDTTIDKIAKQVYGNENYWPILYYANKGLFNSNYKSLILSEYLRKDRDHLFVVDDLPIYSNLGSLGFRDIYVETLKPEDTETYEDYLQSNDLTKETFELFNPIMKGTKDSDFVSGFFIIPIE